MDEPTVRQRLINQMRYALDMLSSPNYSEIHGVIEFDILDTDYCIEHDDLDIQAK